MGSAPPTSAARIGRAAAALLGGRPREAAASLPRGGVKRAFGHAGKHLLGTFGRILRRLGLQVSGVLYLIFALSFGAEAWKAWTRDHQALGRHAVVSLTAMSSGTAIELALALLFLYFGCSSLARAASHAAARRQP